MAFNYQTVTIADYDHTLAIRDHTAILDALRSRDPANVHAVNNEINNRVAQQCIEGNLALEKSAAQLVEGISTSESRQKSSKAYPRK